MLAAEDIAIHRLSIRAQAGATARVDGHKELRAQLQKLARDVEYASWPLALPAQARAGWVLVRAISLRGELHSLRQETARALNTQVARAVDGSRGAADNADAVWFASLPSLIAALLSDIARGKAARWYWQRWSYLLPLAPEQAITRLLFEHSEYLPAIIESLQQKTCLDQVVAQLGSETCKTLAQELLRVRVRAVQTSRAKPLLEVLLDGLVSTAPERDENADAAFHMNRASVRRWEQSLKGLPVDHGRCLLALVLYAICHAPLWLQYHPRQLARAFAMALKPDVVDTASQPPAYKPKRQSLLAPRIKTDGVNVAPEILATANNPKTTAPESARSQAGPVKGLRDTHQGIGRAQTKGFIAQQLQPVAVAPRHNNKTNGQEVVAPYSSDSQEDAATYEQPDFSGDSQWLTQAGGFFYLMNPVQRLLTPALLARQTSANGWCWLIDLLRLMAQEFAPVATVFDQPLKQFLVQQLLADQLEIATHQHPEQAPNWQEHWALIEASPPSAIAVYMWHRLRDQFGHEGWWQELSSSAGFIANPARLVASASHLDIYFPLASVRLDLRLAAWDINPGWLAWLGRVVTLHFVEQQPQFGGSDEP